MGVVVCFLEGGDRMRYLPISGVFGLGFLVLLLLGGVGPPCAVDFFFVGAMVIAVVECTGVVLLTPVF